LGLLSTDFASVFGAHNSLATSSPGWKMAREPRNLKLIIRSLTFWTAFSILLRGVAAQTCVPPKSIEPHKVVDFTICYQNLTTLNTTVFNDAIEWKRWNASGCFLGDPRDGALTLSGCKLICGTGYVVWSAEDSLGRIGMWIVPALVLLGRLAFPLLDAKNCSAVVCHVIGDPIDSLFSLTLRYEIQRWFKRRVLAISGIQQERAEDVAEICIAYEQFGWMATTPGYFEDSCYLDGENLPEAAEWTIIEYAARQLRNFRQKSVRFALIAIATLILSLISAIFQTISRIEQSQTRINIEVAHTIAVVCLLFFPIPLVWFSSKIGTYTSVTEPIHITNSMLRRLKRHPRRQPRRQPLFPNLPFVPSIAPGKEPITINENNWPNHASYYSVHSYWRPSKSLPTDSSFQKGSGNVSSAMLFWLSVSWVVFGAGLPAVFLSATNHTNLREVGIGCRSLSWTLIIALWVLSYLLDLLIGAYVNRLPLRNKQWASIKLQRRIMIGKDFLVSCIIIVAVMMVQFGVYNSCWCRSSFSNAIILIGYSDLQWKVAKILWTGIPLMGLVITGTLIAYVERMGGKVIKERSTV
jgi:hypothetical protein